MNQSNLSVGKKKSLISTSDEAGTFSVLAFDHRQSLIKRLTDQGGGSPEGVYETLSGLKVSVIKALSPYASAVLIDPEYGAAQVLATHALSPGTGLIVALEESGYQGTPTARESTLLLDWSVAKIRRMGADAVKVLIYYHPDAGTKTDLTEDLVLRVVEECRAEDITLFLEAVSYSINPDHDKKSVEFAQGKPDLIARTAARLSELGADVLKLEFPVDPNFNSDRNQWETACRAVTDAAQCPWTVLSAGVAYEVFAEVVEVACSQGASGFMGGRAIWKEVLGLDPSARQAWLTTVARDRLNHLRKIAHDQATPWWAYYPSDEINNYRDWYRGY